MPYPERDHVRDTCLAGHGSAECRYLAYVSINDNIVFSCEKLSPLKRYIDERNRLNRGGPRGDNCEGMDWR